MCVRVTRQKKENIDKYKKEILKWIKWFLTKAWWVSSVPLTGFHNGVSGCHLCLAVVATHCRRLSCTCHLLSSPAGQWFSTEKQVSDFTGKQSEKPERALGSREELVDSQVNEYYGPSFTLSNTSFHLLRSYWYTGANQFDFHNNKIGLFRASFSQRKREGEWDTEMQ